jgi:hypothetical protein
MNDMFWVFLFEPSSGVVCKNIRGMCCAIFVFLQGIHEDGVIKTLDKMSFISLTCMHF